MNPLPPSLGVPNDRLQGQREEVPWLWHGVIALGAITLLSAPEKTGKTTLLSLLLDRRRAGGQLLGRAVWPGKTLVCTEESDLLWSLRQPRLDFGPGVTFRGRFGPIPSVADWQRFLDQLCDRCLEEEAAGTFDLLVIDTAVSFLPLAQRNRRPLHEALGALNDLTKIPLGVLLINQSRTVHRPLAAFADMVLEIELPRGPAGNRALTRRRVFTGVGRYPDMLGRLEAELNAAGTDYELAADAPAPDPPLLAIAEALLAASPTPLTHQDLLTRWPGPPPHPDSLYRTLAAAVQQGRFTTTGNGTKTEPMHYGLARPLA
jgi:AAA domain